ncbi:sigma-70 family RNA polymerase sigma factor [Leptobacterium flavescens]|uniref:Sigma-70 family RNA polymerase sigma factor n=1 Tax=Leptobacterium flavescens TaxID=472055 RepID=A0A6P0UPI2_9FLAO|nr:sigma-70 family RNA polymerase sigma factor [Leptobacterium flavescens]NER14370.1 sigma-70 family RNA polymerase sigma factor [Leptobacterium flavescens]
MEHLELIKACKQNSYQAQIKVYESYKDMMFNACWRILRNEHDAQDAVHDAFIKAFKNIHKLDYDTNLGAWLKRIVINHSLDLLKAKKKIKWLEDTEVADGETDEKDDDADRQWSVERVKKAIDGLKEKYRIIVVLYLIENYTHKEIAQALNLNESTVRNQYKRGKEQLQQQLKNTILS